MEVKSTRQIAVTRITGNGHPQSGTTRTLAWEDTQHVYKNPRWRQQIADGIAASQPYYRDVTTIDPGTGSYSVTYLYFRWRGTYWELIGSEVRSASGNLDGRAPWTPVRPVHLSTADSYNKAIASFSNELAGKMHAFEGMMFLGELRETSKTLKSRTLDFFRQIKRDFRGLKKAPAKTLSRLWLEVQFGWKPFINDIDNLKEAIVKERLHQTRITAKASSPPAATTAIGVVYLGAGSFESTKTSRTTTKSSTRVVGLLSYDKLRALYGDNRELSKYGFDNLRFVPTLWELMPYSWLVDYFTNVGDVINAIHVEKRGLVYHVASTKKITDLEIGYSGSRSLLPAGESSVVGGGHFHSASGHKARRFTFTRVIPSTLVPNLATTYPPLMSTKWVNMLAVAIQKLR